MIEFSTTWFFDGFTHPLETPAHLILLIGLAILLGQQGGAYLIRNIVIFSVAVIAGFVINNYASPDMNNELILLVLALLVSLLVILRLDYRASWVQFIVVLLSLISGIVLGLDSSPIMIPGLAVSTFYNWLFGTSVAITLTVSIIALISFLLRNLLQGVVLRVIGSWIATSALFVLTLLLGTGMK
ncbi:MAG: hypothetical protein DSZ29_07985 [Aquificaceae bacterium]|nr:MAG: hypothetical protein DSZ29_07985 [Aquificaceae bacterium]